MFKFLKTLILLLLVPESPEKPKESGSGDPFTTAVFNPGSEVTVVSPAHTVGMDFDRQMVDRRRNQQQQQVYLNQFMADHRIDLTNYMPSFIERLQERDTEPHLYEGELVTPPSKGTVAGGPSKMGELFNSIMDGTWKANTELGEIQESETKR